MTDIQADSRDSAATGGGSVSDYIALMKLRVMSLVTFTALVGMVAAPGSLHPWLGFVALLAITAGAGAAGALNMWWEADIDRLMRRTAHRPTATGAIQPGEALAFGLTLAGGAVITLGLAANWTAAALLAFTVFFYVVIYTMILKRRTAQNIVIGGAAGAFPPVIGWAAVTGSLDLAPLALFLIIFVWTPPHFWALALVRNDDYIRAKVPMLPVTAGPDETRRQILLYSLLLLPVTLLPSLLGVTGPVYTAGALVLGAAFIWYAIGIYRVREGAAAVTACKRLFGFSILYLFTIFALIIAELLLHLPHFMPVFG